MQTAERPTLNKMRRNEALAGWLFVTPVFLGLVIFQIYPILFSLYISMTRWNFLSPPAWIGLENYATLFFADQIFLKAMGNTALYALGVVLPGLLLALLFASLLNQRIRGKLVYRAIYFVPVVAPVVAVAMIWAWIYHPTFGLINYALSLVGIEGPRWLGSSDWALPSIMIMAIWQGLGYTIVVFLAGLQGISQTYYEAAEIDGASSLHKFLYITFPLISPVTFFLLVIATIDAFQMFSQSYVMTRGGPANATMTIVLHLYNQAFRYQHMGIASSIAYLLFLIVISLTVANFVMQRSWVFYEDQS